MCLQYLELPPSTPPTLQIVAARIDLEGASLYPLDNTVYRRQLGFAFIVIPVGIVIHRMYIHHRTEVT